MDETLRVRVARAALLDVGRIDLADIVGQNRIGDPKILAGQGHPALTHEHDVRLMARAFRLGHEADPEGKPGQLGSEDEVVGAILGSCD